MSIYNTYVIYDMHKLLWYDIHTQVVSIIIRIYNINHKYIYTYYLYYIYLNDIDIYSYLMYI